MSFIWNITARRIMMLVAIMITTTGALSIVARPASAATLLTNISVTVTANMCPSGGTVKRVNVTITTPGTSGSNWSGDTVGGLQAFAGNNTVQGSNFCQTSWIGTGYYWYWSVTRYLSFSGQHTYV
jgi:hypothetical protein